MRKISNKLILVFFSLLAILFYAQPPCPTCPPGGGGAGGGTPGANTPATSPIDMYIYILVITGILFILYYAKKNKSQQA